MLPHPTLLNLSTLTQQAYFTHEESILTTLPIRTQILSTLCVLTIILAGCGGGGSETVRKKEPSSIRAVSTKPLGTTNYHKILDELNLRKAFTYGKVYETPTLITIPLTPRDISDKKTGRIIKERQLLSKLGLSIASAVSKKTGMPANQVKTIIYEYKCKVHILKGVPRNDCDRDSTIEVEQKVGVTIQKLRIALNFIDNILKSKLPIGKKEEQVINILDGLFPKNSFNKKNIKEFCETSLREKLKNYDLKTDCIVAERPDDYGKKKFVIKDVKTLKFVTASHYEKFNISISNIPKSTNGMLSISPDEVYIAYIPFNIRRPNNYQSNIKKLSGYKDFIENTEPKISFWLEEFIKKSIQVAKK